MAALSSTILPSAYSLERSKVVNSPLDLVLPQSLICLYIVSQDTNNPLEVSPANPEVSKQRDPAEGGAQNSSSSSDTSSERERSSGGGGPRKGRKVA